MFWGLQFVLNFVDLFHACIILVFFVLDRLLLQLLCSSNFYLETLLAQIDLELLRYYTLG